MKLLLKILIPTFIIAIAFSLLFIPAEAAKQESGYAIWKSEAAYLANPDRPDTRIEAKKLDPSALATGGFVLCYGDVEITGEDVALGVGIHLVIDLDGHKLTTSRKIQVNNPSANSWRATGSLKIRNGSITHASSQFIQGRPCSEIYLENLKIEAQVKGSNFITESGSRIILFKNCEINFSESASGTFIHTMAAFDATKADIDNGKIDYVRNIVFENTVIKDNTVKADGTSILTLFNRDYRSPKDLLNISFVGTSSFNIIGDHFIKDDCTAAGAKLTVNIAKGACFTEQKVPVQTKAFKVNYYDAITLDGPRVTFGNKTELLTAGEDQDPEDPKLIWGKSASSVYKYQLCTHLASVTWNSKGQEVTVEGYADGVRLSLDKSADSEGIKFGDNGSVTLESHVGWSSSTDFSNPSEYVTLSARENKFYAVFVRNEVSAVAFTDKNCTTPITGGGIVGNQLTDTYLDSLGSDEYDAYIVFYKDMVWATDDTYTLKDNLTIDLGGKSLAKNYLMSKNSGCFIVKGKKLTVKNGSISSSQTGFASVAENGEVALDNVTLTFDTVPAFTLSSGVVNLINGTKLESRTLDNFIPAFAISSADAARVNMSESSVALTGPFAVLSASDGVFGNVDISIDNCDSFLADSVVTVYEYSADAMPDGAKVSVNLNNALIRSREVFDIGTKYNNTAALDVIADINDGCFFTAEPVILSGELNLPAGTTVLQFNEEGNPYSYKVAALELPDMMFNLSLKDSFTANLYVLCDSALTSASTYLNAAPVSKNQLPVTAIDGVAYYKVSVSGINPSSILNAIEIKVSYISSVDGIEYTAKLNYFITDYLDALLDETDPLDKKLAAAAINYVNSAYEYCDLPVTDEFSALLSDDRYLDVLRPVDELPRTVEESDMGNISVAFTGAQLYMSSDLYLRFNLREDFTGTVLLGGQYYTVTDGTYYLTEDTRRVEFSYILVQLDAYSFFGESVDVSGNSLDGTVISGEYGLIDYVNATKLMDNSAFDLIFAFYRYCYEANVYESNGVIPPVNDHTPPLDVEWR